MRLEALALALAGALSAKTVFAQDGTTNAAPPAETTSKVAFAGGHVAYALGPAAGDESGLRQGLDVGAMAGISSYSGGSSSGLPGKSSGLIFGASSLVGFGKYPSYVAGEIGGTEDNAFTGGFGVIGPAVRVDPKAGGGLALRLGGDVFLLEVGFHLIAILVPDRDVVFAFTLGVGRD